MLGIYFDFTTVVWTLAHNKTSAWLRDSKALTCCNGHNNWACLEVPADFLLWHLSNLHGSTELGEKCGNISWYHSCVAVWKLNFFFLKLFSILPLSNNTLSHNILTEEKYHLVLSVSLKSFFTDSELGRNLYLKPFSLLPSNLFCYY